MSNKPTKKLYEESWVHIDEFTRKYEIAPKTVHSIRHVDKERGCPDHRAKLINGRLWVDENNYYRRTISNDQHLEVLEFYHEGVEEFGTHGAFANWLCNGNVKSPEYFRWCSFFQGAMTGAKGIEFLKHRDRFRAGE